MKKKQARQLQGMLFGGATLVKSTDVLAHAGNPAALAGDVSGLAQLGVAQGFGSAVLEMAFMKPKKKRR